MSKGILFILLGLFIDGFQGFISLALFAVGALPGPLAGCAAGNYVAGAWGCWALGALGSIPFINGFIAAATLPIAIGMGMAISFCLSVTLGVFLVTLMQFNGILYPKYLIWGGGELIPGLNAFPFWTTLTILCALKKNAEEGKGITATVSSVAISASSPQSIVAGVVGNGPTPMQPQLQSVVENPQKQPAERNSSLQLSRTMDTDIKPTQKPTAANDNERLSKPANDTLRDIDGRGRTAYAA